MNDRDSSIMVSNEAPTNETNDTPTHLIINDFGAYTHVRNTCSDMFAGVERRYHEYAEL